MTGSGISTNNTRWPSKVQTEIGKKIKKIDTKSKEYENINIDKIKYTLVRTGHYNQVINVGHKNATQKIQFRRGHTFRITIANDSDGDIKINNTIAKNIRIAKILSKLLK